MGVTRSSVACLVIIACALTPSIQAQQVSAATEGREAVMQRLASANPPSIALLQGGRPAVERNWIIPAPWRSDAATAAQQGSTRKPFWTRTKVLIAVGAAVVLAAWLSAAIKKSCREQGAGCFD